MAHKAKGSFYQGFAIKGFDSNNMGADVIGVYKSKSTWKEGADGVKEITTPIVHDLETDDELKVCPDGDKPEGFLFRGVKEVKLGVTDFLNRIPEDYVNAGEAVDFVLYKSGAYLETSLLDETDTPAKGDDVYVASGLFSSVDPTAGSGTVVGEVIEDFGDGHVVIKLA